MVYFRENKVQGEVVQHFPGVSNCFLLWKHNELEIFPVGSGPPSAHAKDY